MEFGELNNLIDIVRETIKKEKPTNNIQLVNIVNQLYNNLKDQYEELTYYELEDLASRFIETKIKFKKCKFNDGNKCFRNLDEKFKIDEIHKKFNVPSKYKDLYDHFMKLYNIPQPEQRSPEWYKYRYTRITASDTATALDLNPYEPLESLILKKCDPNFPFRDNVFVVHGKKYEEIATKVYEHLKNSKVTEFGCLPSEKYKFLGASPDGICSASTIDCKFSSRLGTMLEIKCPYKRPIKTCGQINGEICPNYYFWQIQQQLQCCDLYKCDFWQCNIVEYKSREEYLNDTDFKPVITEGTNSKKLTFNPLICKGCLIQLYPKNFKKRWTREEMISELKPWMLKNNCEDDCPYYQAEYIYPPRQDMTTEEYDKWIINTLSDWKEQYPKFAETHYFNQVLYWKIPNSHNVEVKRDDKLFLKYLPILEDTMKKIEHYRKNPQELKFLQKQADRRKKFMYFTNTRKIKNKFKINHHDLIRKKCLFLNDYTSIDFQEDVGEVDFV